MSDDSYLAPYPLTWHITEHAYHVLHQYQCCSICIELFNVHARFYQVGEISLIDMSEKELQ